MPVPVLSPGHVSPLTFPPIGRLPSAISAAGFHQFCSRHRRYYAAVRLLTSSATASSPRLPVVAHIHQSGLGEMRPPRFRRVPFIRNGVSDHGRAVAPRVTVRNMLPSTLSTASASATLSLSRLNIPLRMIAVYASRPPSPTTTQHSLQGGTLLPYPRRTFTGWNAPASPGALTVDFSLAGLRFGRLQAVACDTRPGRMRWKNLVRAGKVLRIRELAMPRCMRSMTC
jgi:hypothetical protein